MKITLLSFYLSIALASVGQNIDSIKYIIKTSDNKCENYNILSELYLAKSSLDTAKLYADSALYYSADSKNRASSLLNLGNYYYSSSNYDTSLVLFEKSLNIFIELNDYASATNIYSKIGTVHFFKSDYTKSIESFEQAAKYQEKTENPKDAASIYNDIATVYYYMDNYAQAIEFYNISLKIYRDLDNKGGVALGLNNIANAYEATDDYDKAIDSYYQAIRYCDQTGDKSLKAIILNNVAGIYKNWEQYDKALELYNETYEIKKELNNLDGTANVLNNMGIVYRQKKEFDKAEDNFTKAMNIFEQIGNKKRLAITYGNLGNIKTDQKKYSEAIQLYKKSVLINIEINSHKGEALDYIDLSRGYLLINDLPNAENNIRKCINVAEEYNLNFLNLDIYNILSQIYEKKGDSKEALKYYKLWTSVKDSTFSAQKHNKLNELNTKYETEKKTREIELLNIKDEQQQAEIENKKYERNLWIGVSVLAIILGSISVYYYINKKNLSVKLSQKNMLIKRALDDKDILMREIHHRVKNNLQIISSLLNMQSRYLNDDKSKEVVTESKNRIKSMSLIHQKLYQEEHLTGIETKSYFTELIDSLCHSYGINMDLISTNIEDILLDVDTAIPLGLILNEMISNAFKYGVDNKTGLFNFTFSQTNSKELLVVVKDNGPGMPYDFDIKKSKSYGMKLIQSLAKKLMADIKFDNKNGLEITIKIHKFNMINS